MNNKYEIIKYTIAALQTVIDRLKREAGRRGKGCSAATRALAKQCIMELQRIVAINEGKSLHPVGGIMLVPMYANTEEWEAAAIKQQRELKETLKNDSAR